MEMPSPTWPTIGATRPLASASCPRFGQAFGKPRHRHTDVGDHGAGARPQAQAGVERVIAGMPEPAALLGRLRPFETAPTVIGCDRLRRFGLFGNARFRAMEFEE